MVAQRISRRTVVDWGSSATAAGASGSTLRRDGSAAGGRRPFQAPSCRRPRNGETASPERPGWRATRRCDFRCARAPAPGIPAPDGPLRVFLFHGRHDHGPAGAGIAGKLCGQDAKEPDSVQPVGFSAPGASGDQDAGRLDNVVDHAVGGQKSMQPKSIPPGLKAADDKHRRVIRRIQPVAQAGDESKQSCAVARFQTMKLSLGSLALEA